MTRSALLAIAISSALTACMMSPPPSTPNNAPPATTWAMDAEFVESCCCAPICPCIVGSKPTLGHCVGHRLIRIDTGHYEGVDLSGVTAIWTFHIGKWSKIWVDESATEQQMNALHDLLDASPSFRLVEVRALMRVPIRVQRDANRIAYSAPDVEVEVEAMTGFNDEPITIQNLPSFRDYVQYRAVVLRHTAGDDSAFEHSGTNGFWCRYSASG